MTGNAARVERNETRKRKPITTIGSIPEGVPAFVYVGAKRDGRMKIGMSTEPEQRCRSLSLRFVFAHPVTTAAAKSVETEALRQLGHKVGDGEYVRCDPPVAVKSVIAARDIVGRSMHADPSLTEEEARLARIASLGCK